MKFINGIIEKVKKVRAYKTEMSKEYPQDYLFYGFFDKQVNDQEVGEYFYTHYECFLLDNPKEPGQAIRLTGENAQRKKILPVIESKHFLATVYIEDDNECYEVGIANYRKPQKGSEILISQKDIIDITNSLNNKEQNKARQKAFQRSEASSNFPKQ